jgi:hypothetical protein
VKSRSGSTGVDYIIKEKLSKRPKKYFYPIWKRFVSGSYFSARNFKIHLILKEGLLFLDLY